MTSHVTRASKVGTAHELADRPLHASNNHDFDAIAACLNDAVVYRTPDQLGPLRGRDPANESERVSIGDVTRRHPGAPRTYTLTHSGLLAAILLAAALAGFATAHMLAGSSDRQRTPTCSETCAPSAITAPGAARLSPSVSRTGAHPTPPRPQRKERR